MIIDGIKFPDKPVFEDKFDNIKKKDYYCSIENEVQQFYRATDYDYFQELDKYYGEETDTGRFFIEKNNDGYNSYVTFADPSKSLKSLPEFDKDNEEIHSLPTYFYIINTLCYINDKEKGYYSLGSNYFEYYVKTEKKYSNKDFENTYPNYSEYYKNNMLKIDDSGYPEIPAIFSGFRILSIDKYDYRGNPPNIYFSIHYTNRFYNSTPGKSYGYGGDTKKTILIYEYLKKIIKEETVSLETMRSYAKQYDWNKIGVLRVFNYSDGLKIKCFLNDKNIITYTVPAEFFLKFSIKSVRSGIYCKTNSSRFLRDDNGGKTKVIFYPGNNPTYIKKPKLYISNLIKLPENNTDIQSQIKVIGFIQDGPAGTNWFYSNIKVKEEDWYNPLQDEKAINDATGSNYYEDSKSSMDTIAYSLEIARHNKYRFDLDDCDIPHSNFRTRDKNKH